MALRITGSVIGEPITSSFSSATGMWTSQEVAALQKDGIWQVPTSYSLTASASNVNEGSFVIATLTTTGLANGTVIPYVITGSNVFANDFTSGNITGNFVIQNNSNTISFTANADLTLEYAETFTITAGTVSANIIINDTSFPNNIANVVLLLHGNGTNNSQNNTFLDSSAYSLAVTRNGNSTQGTFTPYGANWSNYFDGTGDYLSIPDGVAFEMGTGDFTIEAWVNPSALSASDARIWSYQGAGGTVLILYILASGSGSQFAAAIRSHGATGYTQTNGTTVAKVGTWYHVAFSRSSGTTKLFVNGTQEGSTQTSQTQNIQTPSSPSIGGYSAGSSEYFTGYISNIRVIKGTAVYTTAFSSTVPTTPLTAISGTSLLTCQSNRFKDNSANNFIITKNGDTSVQRFSPFRSITPDGYTANTYSGSVYLDGSGDTLSVATNAVIQLTGDFTIEFWVYQIADGMVMGSDSGTNSDYFGVASTLIYLAIAYPSQNYPSWNCTVPRSTWNHVALTRQFNNIKCYLNGVELALTGGSASESRQYLNSTPLFIGRYGYSVNPNYYTGYISDIRITKGLVIYTGNFTPPTAPLQLSGNTAIYSSTANVNTTFAAANTSLLINGTNAGIIDSSMQNILETVGDSKISTAQSKFGGSSMYFDGTGDYLYIPASANFGFGTGDWTIEGWIYMTDSARYNTIFDTRVGTGTQSGSFSIGIFSGGRMQLFSGGAFLYPTETFDYNTWNHFAVVKYNNVTKIYKNGTAFASTYADTRNYGSSQPIQIGNDDASNFYKGYIDDLRITKGVARYTANFATPTAEFLDY